MKYKYIIFLILFLFIPIFVEAEEYYIDNLDINQELECNDYLIAFTPDDLLSSNENSIAKIYGRVSKAYALNFYFEDQSSVYNNNQGSCTVDSCNNIYISCFPDGKERKWVIDKFEWSVPLEHANLYLKAIIKEPNLRIINQVNDTDKYVAKKDELLKYTINIKNIGDGKSFNNIIVAKIPLGLSIIEDSISDNGIYDKENSLIKWNYDLLESNQEHTFNYYAKIIDDGIKEYVGNSSITSDQIQDEVKSEDTNVSVQKKDEEIKEIDKIKNPNTGVNDYIIVSILIMIISIVVFIILKRKKVIFLNRTL